MKPWLRQSGQSLACEPTRRVRAHDQAHLLVLGLGHFGRATVGILDGRPVLLGDLRDGRPDCGVLADSDG